MVAMESGGCRSVRTGRAAGEVVGGKLRKVEQNAGVFFNVPLATQTLGHQIAIRGDAHAGVVVKPTPGAALEVGQAHFLRIPTLIGH
jgi:hypothetical protein